MIFEMAPDVPSLLARFGIEGTEVALAHNGYSGARITAITHGDVRCVLKRVRLADDWIMRRTDDVQAREAQFAACGADLLLPAQVSVATLGAARDGDGWALLMRDVTPWLLPEQGVVPPALMTAVIRGIARLHAAHWDAPPPPPVSFVADVARLCLLSPATGQMLIAEGRDFGLARGWEAFERVAPADAVALVARLYADPAIVTARLSALPRTLLHGDLKIANMAIEPDGALCLLDWAMVGASAVALDIAWFLAVNSSRLPWPLDEALSHYAAALEAALGPAAFARVRWPEQRSLVAICGLMLYGWGKALDTEDGRPDELGWWCDGALAGARDFGV